jgi:ATP-dependent RNA helicase DeaD
MKFTEFKFKKQLQEAIDKASFVEASPVQEKSIPMILEGKDLISQAQTGTGKTAAFGLPIIEMMKGSFGVEMLVIVPTRELAIQVADELFRFSRNLKIKTTAVYGGSPYRRQIEHINTAGIVVATPGRLLDLLSSGKVSIKPKFVVLDEADEMLNMGFIEDIKKIFSYIPEERQTLLFSATMPDAIKRLSRDILDNPEEVRLTPANVTNDNIEQYFYVVSEAERKDALVRLLDTKNPTKSIVFCRTKREVDKIDKYLQSLG